MESCQTKYLSPSGKYPKLRLIPFYCVNINGIQQGTKKGNLFKLFKELAVP
jgi:hypothetical protein